VEKTTAIGIVFLLTVLRVNVRWLTPHPLPGMRIYIGYIYLKEGTFCAAPIILLLFYAEICHLLLEMLLIPHRWTEALDSKCPQKNSLLSISALRGTSM
jgi:hypothetical protein